MPYNFLFCFQFSNGKISRGKPKCIEFEGKSTGESLKLIASGERLESNRRWRIFGKSYKTREEACSAAEAIRIAVLYYSIQTRTGIDYGNHPGVSKSGVTQEALDLFTRLYNDTYGEPTIALSDNLGMQIFEAQKQIIYSGFSGESGEAVLPDKFVNSISQAYKGYRIDSAQKELAIELYTMSHFERTIAARFLILCTCLETLIETPPRTQKAFQYIERLVEQTKSADIPNEDRDSLLGSLRHLKKESISQAGKKMSEALLGSKKYADKKPSDFFKYIYNLRSQLVHSGNLDQRKISPIFNEIDKFVADILERQFTSIT